ncbi:MAG: DUF3990 domain-containing protein [Catonella sp.]|nr:DUF3990 domain-containing protein [Catonella sp.]MDY6356262.1 DUF3990 domain-containing protein [Catonella sp.]
MTLYHGTDRILSKPLFDFGSPDNDYGKGFYTSPEKERAEEWAMANGHEDSNVVNIYEIDLDGLNILNLDDYGILSWIADV